MPIFASHGSSSSGEKSSSRFGRDYAHAMNSTSGTGSKSSSGNSSGKPKLASLTKGLSDLRVRTESMLDKITGAPEAQPSDAQWDRKVGRRTTADEMNEYNDDGPVLGAALSPTAGSLGRTQQASRGAKESLLGKKRVMNRSDEYYDGDYLNSLTKEGI